MFYCFNFGPHEDDNVLCLQAANPNEWPLIRIQSACFTAEIFRSTDCDCHEQLETALLRIQEEGGYFIYILQDGRGAGIFNKVKGLHLGDEKGLDTADAYDALGIQKDPRSYERIATVVRHFNITKARLLTNNPRKMKGLMDAGVEVRHEPLEIPPTTDSQHYLETKKNKLGHMLQVHFPDALK